LYAFLAVIAVLCLLLMVVVAIIVGAVNKIDSAAKKAEKLAQATCVGETYPDQQKRDMCADATNTVVLGGLTVTASPLTLKTADLGARALCSTVTLQNTSTKSRDYNVLDFKLQTPNGDVATASFLNFAGGTLGSGVLISGGTKTGLICSDFTGEKGRYVFIYKPDPFQPDRGIWLFDV